ncbi:hypothetical protein PRZ48_013332 [Zasmidium cellare]|uniref:Copper transport protein n=1 Tax=Zasmidium cellare TaxID=395010 RepID=A0ABR0E0R2_ZASCE|nr:hypothetical protein PRZ48_013332 [Zasmidium cellare]
MNGMAMVFFTATNTPLFSFSWIPDTTGQYAGTCIFLIALAAIFRALLAVRIHFYDIFAYVRHRPQPKGCSGKNIRPWRAGEVMTVGLLDVVVAGVGYLLDSKATPHDIHSQFRTNVPFIELVGANVQRRALLDRALTVLFHMNLTTLGNVSVLARTKGPAYSNVTLA